MSDLLKSYIVAINKLEREAECEKLKLIGTKEQIEYWRGIFGEGVEYIESKPIPCKDSV